MSRRSDWNPDNTGAPPVVSADTIRVDRRRRPPRAASWAHLARGAHAVQFYSQDSVLLDLLSGFVGGALVRGEAAVVIATPVHRHQLNVWLRSRCFDLDAAARQGRYAELDASAVLKTVMRSASPDPDRLKEVILPVIERVSGRSTDESRHVSIFGEVVALLWAQGRTDAAVRLEEIWNALPKRSDYSLCCAYPVSSFTSNSDATAFLKICNQHSHLFPADRRINTSFTPAP